MAKLHTRQKRRLRMEVNRGRVRIKRPKTFKTEDSAKKYAEAKGLKSFELINLRSEDSKSKKLRIVAR